MVSIHHDRSNRSPFREDSESTLNETKWPKSLSRSETNGVSFKRPTFNPRPQFSRPEYSKHNDNDSNTENRYYKPKNLKPGDSTDTSLDESFWIKRREMRERAGSNMNSVIWEKNPTKVDSDVEDNHILATKQKSSNYNNSSASSSDEDRKIKKSKKRKKNKKHSHVKKKNRHEVHNGKKSHHKRKKKQKHKSSSSESSSESEIDSEDEKAQFIKLMKIKKHELELRRALEEEENECFGPVLPSNTEHSGLLPLDYGRALLPGEGAAMAAYIAEGKRIPRRGEIGLTCDEIDSFEKEGYVMSGSRHSRMEAVRLRKENQIYSADEKRALEHFNHAERAKREAKLQAQFKALIKRKLEDKQSTG